MESHVSVERDEDDLMTSALASSLAKQGMLQPESYSTTEVGQTSNGLATEDGNSVLSLSGFLLQIETEQQRKAANVNGDSVDTLSAVRPPLCILQEKQFQEEKKQDHGDDHDPMSSVTASDINFSSGVFQP